MADELFISFLEFSLIFFYLATAIRLVFKIFTLKDFAKIILVELLKGVNVERSIYGAARFYLVFLINTTSVSTKRAGVQDLFIDILQVRCLRTQFQKKPTKHIKFHVNIVIANDENRILCKSLLCRKKTFPTRGYLLSVNVYCMERMLILFDTI